ncbi:hypothetical protein [Apilactobacillus timberlakei]|uniref:hypothetical protein n=1 Tax=Apilactobacillus timberlakei TaxID=2008380 RepID=UPI0015E83C16|nr:hypothetical protein [Apilactobacillus timberlakei]
MKAFIAEIAGAVFVLVVVVALGIVYKDQLLDLLKVVMDKAHGIANLIPTSLGN